MISACMRFLVALGLVALATGPARAGFEVVVCYPGGGNVTAAQAQPAMDKMLRLIEKLGGWPQGTFQHRFTSRQAECDKLLAGRPAFVMTSLGQFLAHRLANHLVPLAQPEMGGSSQEIYRVLTRKGGPADLAGLKGKSLGGSLLDEPKFLGKVVFAGRIDPASYFRLEPGRRALRDLRKLAKGQLDAVLVNQQQYRALGSLPFADKLQVAYTSKPLPLVGLAADDTKTTAAERERLTKALTGLCADAAGKDVCDLFGLQTFVPANPKDYKAVIELWNGN